MDAISVGLQGLYNHYTYVRWHDAGRKRRQYYGVSLNAAYALGPGISLEGQVAWTQSDTTCPAQLSARNVNSYEIDFGTAINF